MLFVIAAVAAVVMILVGLKMMAAAKAKPAKPAAGMIYKTNASDIERYVRAADHWTPHLNPMPLFWVGVFGTLLVLVLDFHFGHSRGGWWGLAVLGSLFAIADLAIPFVALRDATDDGKRGIVGITLLVVFTAMSYMVVIGSTAEISTTTAARMNVGVASMSDMMKQLQAKQNERDAIRIDRGAEALAGLAQVEEELAKREESKERGGCKTKCDLHKKAGAELRAREADQRRKEKLTGEIEALKASLSGMNSNEARTDADAMATVISGMTMGIVSRDTFRVYALTIFGLIMVTGLTLLWVYVGGDLRDAIFREREIRGEIGDEARQAIGLPAKYTTAPADAKRLPPPDGDTSAAEQGITINIMNADMRKRYENDKQLLEVADLFGTLLMRADGGSVPFSALYRAYQVKALTEQRARYMTQPTLVNKLYALAGFADDFTVTADVIEGWVLKPAESRKQEVNAHVE